MNVFPVTFKKLYVSYEKKVLFFMLFKIWLTLNFWIVK